MGVKDIDLNERHDSEQLQDHIQSLSFESIKNVSGVITAKLTSCIEFRLSESHKAYVGPREAGIHVLGLDEYEETSVDWKTEINPAVTRHPIPVSGLTKIETTSVNDQINFKSEYNTDCQKDTEVVLVSELRAQSVLKSKPGQLERKYQVKEIQKPTVSSDAPKWFWTYAKWILGLYICYAICRVPGAEATYLRNKFPPVSMIELHHYPMDQWNRSNWLCGRETIKRNSVKADNLLVSDQEIKNYVLEIILTNGNRSLLPYPLKAFNACTLADNEYTFKEGKKSFDIELIGRGTVIKYLLEIQNQTLHVHFVEGTGRQIDAADLQCKIKTIDMSPPVHSVRSENDTTTVGTLGEEKSSVIKILGFVAVAAIIGTAGVAFVYFCVVKLVRRNRALKTAKRQQLLDSVSEANCSQESRKQNGHQEAASFV